MKKTVTINISGIIFHIDEDAYDRLNRYMSRLKRHFAKMEGRDEIITDIEARIAELLQEKITDSKQVIIIADIEKVVKILGEPSEMEGEIETDAETEQSHRYRRAKRLYRDSDNKKIAGVASGLSAYLNIDDPLWMRLLFVVSIFISGAGIIAYGILWIVVPEAITTTEKLEMRGEPVNISNIERSFRDEFGNVKDKFNDIAVGAKETINRKNARGKTIFDDIFDVLGGIVRVLVKVIVIAMGLFLIFTGLGFITAFVVGTAGFSSFSFFEHDELISFSLTTFLDMFFPGKITGIMSVVSVLLLVGIPLIMIIYLGIRLIFGTSVKVPYIGITSFAAWLVGLIMAAVVAASTGIDFRHSARINEDYEIRLEPGKTLYIEAHTDPELNKTHSHSTAEIFDGEWNIRFDNDDYILYSVPDFSATNKSQDGLIRLEVSAYAKGSGRNEAYGRAEDLIYPVKTNDSTITLSTYYRFPRNAKIRSQYVQLKLWLPVGQIVYFDKNMETFFDDNPHYYYRRKSLEGNTWIMTESGLKPYLEGTEQDESYLYNQQAEETQLSILPAIKLAPIRGFISIPLIGL